MTAAEVISYALTRNLDESHIKDSDIAISAKMYADGLSESDDYVKEVIAYGVIINIWERISTELTDRGIVQMVSQGATLPSWETSQRAKQEYVRTLEQLIGLMNGVTVEEEIMVLTKDVTQSL